MAWAIWAIASTRALSVPRSGGAAAFRMANKASLADDSTEYIPYQ